jgi:ABC-type amino acid transport substrate-binding protein
MKHGFSLLTLLAAVAVTLAIQNFAFSNKPSDTAKTETAYDRVMRTGTLRCAYAIYPPYLTKDANSGKIGGVMAEMMAGFELTSGIKIEWGPEIDWANIAPTLQTGKADAFCAGMWLTPGRGKVVAGSKPIFFNIVEAYARQDDKRFDNNRDRINKPDVRISVNLGDVSEEIAIQSFPLAQRVYIGEMGGQEQLFIDVANNKADMTVSGPTNLSTYNLNNAKIALRKIEFDEPLRTFQNVIGVDIHEQALLNLINATLVSVITSGIHDRALKNNVGTDYNVSYIAAEPED